MNLQHKIYLSIGTNMGNRLQNLQDCFDMLHQQVGTIIAISSVYESVSWGFDSAPFLNCVLLLHSNKVAFEILEEVQDIEKKLGRVKTVSSEYEARCIDVDIVSFDDAILNDENLQIPHALAHKRLFVLLPLQEINPFWNHPISKKSIANLIVDCVDTNACKIIGKLENPLQKMELHNFNYIAIEGNIGAGKTTLAHKIAEDFNAKTLLERFAENPFLPKFYQDQSRFAFPLEMSFLADRYQQISDDLRQFDLFTDFVVADYHIFKSLIFAKVTLAEDEFRLYKTLFDIIYKEIPKPDLYIYLYQKPEKLLENIKKRGRDYEQKIPEEYLEKINQGYLDYIKSQTNFNIVIIDVSDKDFVKNQEDYVFVLEQIMGLKV